MALAVPWSAKIAGRCIGSPCPSWVVPEHQAAQCITALTLLVTGFEKSGLANLENAGALLSLGIGFLVEQVLALEILQQRLRIT